MSLVCMSCYSCTSAQIDQLLVNDTIIKVKVYQSDVESYIKSRNIIDTAGKQKDFIKIVKAAKMLSSMYSLSKNGEKIHKTYAESLSLAEENFRRRTMVDKILVVKSQRKMYLLKQGKIVKSINISLGPNPIGQKQFEGDGKTPEGIYTLDWQRWNSPNFHSFHISYPNRVDSLRAISNRQLPGSNIMIHGTTGFKKKRDWTNGCIGISNADMIDFRTIVFQDTPIEITK